MQRVFSIGIIVHDLQPSQLSYYIIQHMNQLLRDNNQADGVIFYETLSLPCMRPMCALMNMSEIWSFNGIIISTTIDNTIVSGKAINNALKFFYVWDLEWMRSKNDYIHNIQAYRNPSIQLIARSLDHAKAIEKYCNRLPSFVLPNFNLMGLMKALETQNESRTRNG